MSKFLKQSNITVNIQYIMSYYHFNPHTTHRRLLPRFVHCMDWPFCLICVVALIFDRASVTPWSRHRARTQRRTCCYHFSTNCHRTAHYHSPLILEHYHAIHVRNKTTRPDRNLDITQQTILASPLLFCTSEKSNVCFVLTRISADQFDVRTKQKQIFPMMC